MTIAYDPNSQKNGEDRTDTIRTPLQVYTVGPDADHPGASDVINQHQANIAQFVDWSRQQYSLSSVAQQRSAIETDTLGIEYHNQSGTERLFLCPRLSGGELPEEPPVFRGDSALMLMILYGDSSIAAIPMTSLKNPDKLKSVYLRKVNATFGKDPLLTSQYRFVAKNATVVLCPIKVTKTGTLTIEDNHHLSLVGGQYAEAFDKDQDQVQPLADASGGRAFSFSVETKTDKHRIPVISGNDTNIWTPLETFHILVGGKLSDPEAAGDDKTLPYAISGSGDYYYWPIWSPWPSPTVMLTLGYEYFETDEEHIRYLYYNFGRPEVDGPSVTFGEFNIQNFPKVATEAVQDQWLANPIKDLPKDLVASKDGKSYATPASLIGQVEDKILASVTPPSDPLGFPSATLGFGTYTQISGGSGSVPFLKAGDTGPLDYGGSVPVPIYTPPHTGDKKDAISTTMVKVTATDNSHSVPGPVQYGPGPDIDPHPPSLLLIPIASVFINYDWDYPQPGFVQYTDSTYVVGQPYAVPIEVVITNVSGGVKYEISVGSTCSVVTGTPRYGSPARLISRYTIADVPLPPDPNTATFYNGPETIGIFDQSVTHYDPDPITRLGGTTNSQLLYLTPFPPSLGQDMGKYYLVKEEGVPGDMTDLSLTYNISLDSQDTRIHLTKSSQLTIFTPYGNFSGKSFKPWIHVSNGEHFIQGFQVDGKAHLYLDSIDITDKLPAALTGKDSVYIDDIKTMIMDVPLGVVKNLK
jgi:hypothetical protein